jgi:phosphatidylglycerol---prolipoprotein diacylglyceryl transferase
MIQLFPTREIALSILSVQIHWYGLLYAASFIIGLYVVKKLQKYSSLTLTDMQWSSIATAIVLGVIIGGRLGYVVLYEISYFLQNPLQIFAVWNGGMSSHGGFIGVAIAIFYQSNKQKLPLLPLVDLLIVPIAIGLFLGRLGNLINLELYGRATLLPWGIAIPGVEELRHPTQIYAMMKDAYLAITAYILLRLTTNTTLSGLVTAVFLVQYSLLRLVVEYFRVPTHQSFNIIGIEITRGQLYSVPIFIVGVIIAVQALLKVKKVSK